MSAAPLLVSLLVGRPLGAQVPAPAGTPVPDEQSELEALLRQETEVATKTRLNHDYVPGMVTVLDGDELESLGIRNVWEALSLVPGVQTVRDLYGSPLLLVRGVNFIFNSGSIKILVDSVPLNQESAGINSSILLMPVEDVERIELVRGPGSAIHGDFAYMGLLNIVTRRSERRAFAATDGDALTGGAMASWSGARAGDRFGLGLSGLRSRDVDGGGPARESDGKGFGRIFLQAGGFSVTLQGLLARHDGAGGSIVTEERLSVQARYARDVTPALHAEAYAGVLVNDDSVVAKEYRGRAYQAGVDFRLAAPGRHALLLTLGAARSEIVKAHLFLPPLFDQVVGDITRRSISAALQDQWDVTPAFTVTAGARVDRFDDAGTEVTPRLGLVLRLGDHHILKTQYSEGFRTPGFFEQYGTGATAPLLRPETIGTAELSYILRAGGTVGRVTLFQSDLRDMVQPSPIPGRPFTNDTTSRIRGVEVEWTQQLGPRVKASANVSWVDPEDRRATRDVTAAAEWLGNVTLLADVAPWLRLAGRLEHVGTRGGFLGTRTTPGYDVVDLTASATKLLPGLALRAGVRNLLDDEVLYITTLPPPFDPILQRYGGRAAWVQLSYRF